MNIPTDLSPVLRLDDEDGASCDAMAARPDQERREAEPLVR